MQERLEKNRPYIKKPLNAFMVFMREQRPHIDEEVKRKGNGVVNMHLAQKVGASVAPLRLGSQGSSRLKYLDSFPQNPHK